jgi:hypothetical protein
MIILVPAVCRWIYTFHDLFKTKKKRKKVDRGSERRENIDQMYYVTDPRDLCSFTWSYYTETTFAACCTQKYIQNVRTCMCVQDEKGKRELFDTTRWRYCASNRTNRPVSEAAIGRPHSGFHRQQVFNNPFTCAVYAYTS